MYDKRMKEWLKRQEGYRKWREAGHGEKVIYSPSAYSKEDIKKRYDKLSKPTESERLQDELEPIDKETEKFLDDIANNTPNVDQFKDKK